MVKPNPQLKLLAWMVSYGGPQLSRQNLFRHGRIVFVTAESFLSQQTHKSFSSRQNHFNHGKIIFVTAKSFSSRQNHFGHGKIIFVTAKSFLTAAKSFSTKVNRFCTHVTSVPVIKWGWKACATPTSRLYTPRLISVQFDQLCFLYFCSGFSLEDF